VTWATENHTKEGQRIETRPLQLLVICNVSEQPSDISEHERICCLHIDVSLTENLQGGLPTTDLRMKNCRIFLGTMDVRNFLPERVAQSVR